MTEPIRGKVAKILSDRRVAINRGAADGVAEGMRFAILSNADLALKDPDTGEELGAIGVAKTIVKVVSVDERFAIARTFRTIKSSGIFSAITTTSMERHETLRAAEPTAERELPEKDSRVKTGDVAVQVFGEEFEGLTLGF